jgi:hypothetical protein
MKRISFLILAAMLLTSCAAPAPGTPTSTIFPTHTNTTTPTKTPTPTPKPAWLMNIETQDPQDAFFKVIGNQPVIDLYDTPEVAEAIILIPESIQVTATTDVLYPDILSAQDARGIQYAFNPGLGWFQIPAVQMDYTKVPDYTVVPLEYFIDGRFALVSALKYVENPTISPDAPIPTFWVNSNIPSGGIVGYSNFVEISMNPISDLYRAQSSWPTLIKYFSSENKPFAWAGFYLVYVNNGADYFYVLTRTIKTGINQTQGLAYGMNGPHWRYNADLISVKMHFNSLEKGMDISIILAPTDDSKFLWNPDLASYTSYSYGPNPIVARLQERGELISLFSPEDQQTILDVLYQVPTAYDSGYVIGIATAPLKALPPGLSKYILMPGQD